MTEDVKDPENKDVEKAFAARLASATSKDREKITVLEDQLQQERDLLQQERSDRVRLEESRKTDEPPEHTREELLTMVEDEKLTQVQADKLWEEQITTNVTKKVLGAVAHRDSSKQVDQTLGEYKRLKPTLLKNGSEDREKVSREYEYLIGTGLPNSVATELAAVRNVFGPVENLKKKLDLETHQETGGGSPPETVESDVAKGLSTRQKKYYQKRIDDNVYKDWAEVEAELKYSSRG